MCNHGVSCCHHGLQSSNISIYKHAGCKTLARRPLQVVESGKKGTTGWAPLRRRSVTPLCLPLTLPWRACESSRGDLISPQVLVYCTGQALHAIEPNDCRRQRHRRGT